MSDIITTNMSNHELLIRNLPSPEIFQQRRINILNTSETNRFIQKIKKGSVKPGTDIDGVDIDSANSAIRILNGKYSTNYTKSQMKTYFQMTKWMHDLGSQDPKQDSIHLWNSDRSLGIAYPEDGAYDLSVFMYENGIVIPRITSRPADTAPVTIWWYQQWMPWILDHDCLHMQTESNDINPKFKTDRIKEQEITHFLEDSPEQAEQIVNDTDATVIIVIQPWNASYMPTSNRIIVPSDHFDLPPVQQAFMTLASIA